MSTVGQRARWRRSAASLVPHHTYSLSLLRSYILRGRQADRNAHTITNIAGGSKELGQNQVKNKNKTVVYSVLHSVRSTGRLSDLSRQLMMFTALARPQFDSSSVPFLRKHTDLQRWWRKCLLKKGKTHITLVYVDRALWHSLRLVTIFHAFDVAFERWKERGRGSQ